MKKRVAVLVSFVAAFFVLTPALNAQQRSLESGYVMCELSAAQLSWFMAPDTDDFLGQETPGRVQVYPNGHPSKEADMVVNGRLQRTTKGRKALEKDWCRKTRSVDAPVTSVDSCEAWVAELPNGGCRIVTIERSSRTWYTFGDAVE